MADRRLRLSADRLSGGAWFGLPAANRVLYVLEGEVAVTHRGMSRVGPGEAWFGPSPCSLSADGPGATVLRFELVAPGAPGLLEWPGVDSRQILEHDLMIGSDEEHLMRCDRVEFAPGGEARPHGHRGGGIRYLLAGALEVRVGGARRVMTPGDAWFETGVEPVHAVASATEPTAFVRVSVLPAAVRGKSSIVYVDPADAAVTPRRYTVLVDEPIEVGA